MKKSSSKKKKPESNTGIDNIYTSLSRKFPSNSDIEIVPTGTLAFDNILFGLEDNIPGGLPRGRFIELCSPAGLGKSTCALVWSRNICKKGGTVVYIDFENAVNESLLQGVKISEYKDKTFLLHKANTFSDLQELFDAYLSVKGITMIIVDSITAVMPSKLADINIEKMEPALHARMTSTLYLKYKAMFSSQNVTGLFINQVRNSIDFTYGAHERPAGGKAQEFYMDVRVMMKKAGDIYKNRESKKTKDSVMEGVDLGVWTSKNKITFPFKTSVCSILFGKGVSDVRWVMFYLKEQTDRIKQSSAGRFEISLEGLEVSKIQGYKALEDFIRAHYKEALNTLDKEGLL